MTKLVEKKAILLFWKKEFEFLENLFEFYIKNAYATPESHTAFVNMIWQEKAKKFYDNL